MRCADRNRKSREWKAGKGICDLYDFAVPALLTFCLTFLFVSFFFPIFFAWAVVVWVLYGILSLHSLPLSPWLGLSGWMDGLGALWTGIGMLGRSGWLFWLRECRSCGWVGESVGVLRA